MRFSLLFIISDKLASWSVNSVCVKTFAGISLASCFTTTAEVRAALLEVVVSKFLALGSFLLRGDVQIQGNTESTVYFQIIFSSESFVYIIRTEML